MKLRKKLVAMASQPSACRHVIHATRMSPSYIRTFSSSQHRHADTTSIRKPLFNPQTISQLSPSKPMMESPFSGNFPGFSAQRGSSQRVAQSPPHHLNIFATKHNTHITLTRPNREVIMSVACGNIGIKKGKRGSFESAYQLAAVTFMRMRERGLLANITELELIFRGFGKGREAVTKVISASEGRLLRNRIVRVTDSTRTKFGGTRSPNPRRL